MNVLFVYSIDDAASPLRPLRTPEEMQFGISYISAVLKKRSHDTRLVVLSRVLGNRNKVAIDTAIKEFEPKLLCFTAVASEYLFIRDMAVYVKKKYPSIYGIAGGAHISLNPEEAISGPFDALCIGEGEYPVLELVTQLENGKKPFDIPNLWIKNGTAVEKNKTRPFMKDIDSLPFPDRVIWRDWVIGGAGTRQPVLLGRGCPFVCTYCSNHALRRLQEGAYVRLRSPDNIVTEIEEIAVGDPMSRDFYLEVETIGANMSWALELCKHIEILNNKFDRALTFGTNLRITPGANLGPLFEAFSKSNFKFVRIGVESGSQRVRREILNRHYSNQDIIDTAKLTRKHRMNISFYNLIGVPGETVSDFKETIHINRICQPDQVYAHIFFPYPGTELYKTCVEKGLLKETPDAGLERCKATLDLPGFSKRDIQRGFIWFDFDVYRGHKPIMGLLARTMVSACRSNIFLHYVYRHATYSPLLKLIKSALKVYIR